MRVVVPEVLLRTAQTDHLFPSSPWPGPCFISKKLEAIVFASCYFKKFEITLGHERKPDHH